MACENCGSCCWSRLSDLPGYNRQPLLYGYRNVSFHRPRLENIYINFQISSRGELGVGLIRRVDEPVHIEQLVGIRIKKVACGGWHTVALTEGGDAYTWGWNRYGQLGKDKVNFLLKVQR